MTSNRFLLFIQQTFTGAHYLADSPRLQGYKKHTALHSPHILEGKSIYEQVFVTLGFACASCFKLSEIHFVLYLER